MNEYAVIVAADLPRSDAVIELIEKVGGIVDGIKIGLPTIIESGADTVRRSRDIIGGKPLLVDLKIADIGFRSGEAWDGTNAKIIRALAGAGATHVTVHGFPGPVSIAESAQVAREANMDILLLPLMSHAGADTFFSRPMDASILRERLIAAGLEAVGSPHEDISDVTEAIITLGEMFQAYGYIAPATRPEDLRRYRSVTERPLWCPGFGRQDRLGRSLEEQVREWARIVGPKSAAIVGSAIFKSDEPEKAAREICMTRDRIAAGG